MNFNYDLSDCLVRRLQGFLTVPSEIAGKPVDISSSEELIVAAGKAGDMG